MTFVRAGDWPASGYAYDDTPISNVSATSYTPGTPEVGVYFVTRPSARAMITIGGAARDNTNDNRLFMATNIYSVDVYGNKFLESSPDVHLNGWGIPGSNADYMYASRTFVIQCNSSFQAPNLFGGFLAYVQLVYMAETTTSASADIAMRELMVEPIG